MIYKQTGGLRNKVAISTGFTVYINTQTHVHTHTHTHTQRRLYLAKEYQDMSLACNNNIKHTQSTCRINLDKATL